MNKRKSLMKLGAVAALASGVVWFILNRSPSNNNEYGEIAEVTTEKIFRYNQDPTDSSGQTEVVDGNSTVIYSGGSDVNEIKERFEVNNVRVVVEGYYAESSIYNGPTVASGQNPRDDESNYLRAGDGKRFLFVKAVLKPKESIDDGDDLKVSLRINGSDYEVNQEVTGYANQYSLTQLLAEVEASYVFAFEVNTSDLEGNDQKVFNVSFGEDSHSVKFY